MVRQHSSSWAGPSDRTAIAGSALRSRERSTGQVQEAADIDKGRVPADADVVGDLGGGLVEVAQLGRQVGQPLVVREVGVRSGVRTAGEGARRWGREGVVEVVSELPGALVSAVVGAVAGDVALPEAVAAQQVIHAGGYAIAVLAIACEEMGDDEDDEVIEDAPVGAPIPAFARCVRLAPRLRRLQRQEPVSGVYHAVPDVFVVRQRGAV